jgi:hypothetical protein
VAAFIPIIASVAPSIISLIAGLVHKNAPIAEATHGPGTGPVKFADVFTAVITALQSAAAAGQIDKTLPSDDSIKAIIQAVVSSMQLSGLLGATASTPPSSPGNPAAGAVGIVVLKIVGGTIQVQQ